MCDRCGCGDPDIVPVDVHESILADNDARAGHNRAHFESAGVLAINLMGSPGSGKTAVLEATARAAPQRYCLGAISADLATDRDASRLANAGIRSASVTTGTACHLDAQLVHRALHGLPWRECDLLFIENVGNLVCPAVYDLGQAVNVVALSVTEGEDKPLKYPVMFRKADLVLLTKMDLCPHLDVDVGAIHDALAQVMPVPAMLAVSGRTGLGIDRWISWLEDHRPRPAPAEVLSAHAHVAQR